MTEAARLVFALGFSVAALTVAGYFIEGQLNTPIKNTNELSTCECKADIKCANTLQGD